MAEVPMSTMITHHKENMWENSVTNRATYLPCPATMRTKICTFTLNTTIPSRSLLEFGEDHPLDQKGRVTTIPRDPVRMNLIDARRAELLDILVPVDMTTLLDMV